MSKYTKHINQGESITIDGEEFILKAAGSDKVVKPYFTLMQAFSGVKATATDEESTAQMLENFDDKTAEAVSTLIEETLIASYPDEPVDEMKVFAMKYMMQLMPVVMKLYAPAETKNVEQVKKMEAFQKIREAKQDAINQEQV